MLSDFSMGFDPQSLDELARLQGFDALLAPEITRALTESGTLLVAAAQARTWQVFEHPTGQLAGSIYFYVVSPSEIALAVGVPYGRRREYGFSGMTDSLGRTYMHDPAKPYLEPTLQEHQQEVVALVERAVNTALERVALG